MMPNAHLSPPPFCTPTSCITVSLATYRLSAQYYNFSAFRHRYTMPGFIPPMSDGGAVGNFWYSFDYGTILW